MIRGGGHTFFTGGGGWGGAFFLKIWGNGRQSFFLMIFIENRKKGFVPLSQGPFSIALSL